MLSDRLKVGAVELDTQWTLEDAEEAHLALDLAEDAAVYADRMMSPKSKGRG